MMDRRRSANRRSIRPLAAVIAATAAATLLVGIGVTTAAFNDRAAVNVNGDPGIGGRFDIAVNDSGGTTLVEAVTMGEAAILPLAPSATQFSKNIPLHFSATAVNKDGSTPGALSVSLQDPDPEDDDVYAHLRFTVDIDGSAVATDVSAEEFNALGARISQANPGESHTITLLVHLDEATPRAYNGRYTAIGIAFDGEATP